MENLQLRTSNISPSTCHLSFLSSWMVRGSKKKGQIKERGCWWVCFNPMVEWPLPALPSSLALPPICISAHSFLAVGWSVCKTDSLPLFHATITSSKWSLIKCWVVLNQEEFLGCFTKLKQWSYSLYISYTLAVKNHSFSPSRLLCKRCRDALCGVLVLK